MSIFKRGSVYWYHFLFNGEHVQKSTKQGNPRVARQMEAAHRTALAKGEVGITERKTVPTLAAFIENRFVPWAQTTFEKSSPKTWTCWYRTQLGNISAYPPLVSRKLDTITSEHASDYAAHLQRKGLMPSSVNSSLRVLRRVQRLAVEWGNLERRWDAGGCPSDGWVWPSETASGHIQSSTTIKQHRNALRKSGVRPFVLYSLRHTFLTRLGEAGRRLDASQDCWPFLYRNVRSVRSSQPGRGDERFSRECRPQENFRLRSNQRIRGPSKRAQNAATRYSIGYSEILRTAQRT